ncbi:hypothetical protein V6N13_071636 [Hibiscus sabdariffa]
MADAPDDPRLPKKQRRRDEASSDVQDITVPAQALAENGFRLQCCKLEQIFQKVSSKSLGKRGTTSDDKQLTNSLLKVPGNSLVSAQVPSSFDTCSSLMTVPIDVAEHGQVAMID